jgi:hypothetical protein
VADLWNEAGVKKLPARGVWVVRTVAAAAALACLGVAVSCSEDEAQFQVRFAPDFAKSQTRVSILGVFRDGRMNAETWDEIGPRLSAPFAAAGGTASCPIAFDKDFLSKKEELAGAIDDVARADGVTDDLLDKLAPAASGDDVLVFTVAGRPTSQSWDGGAGGGAAPMGPPNSTPGGGMRGSRGARGMGGGGMGPMRQPDKNVFELTASLYSAKDHRAVGLVAMRYTGSSGPEALSKFVAKLREQLPAASCTGWHWDVPVDPKAIEALRDSE